MTNPTSNFGWQMPEPTDLVTDLPADFEVFGQAVDTDFVDLLGGTTGQVLSKTSNTDLDFTWVNDASGMTNPMTTTGDIIYSSSGSTPGRIGIGSTGNVLTVASGIPSWAAPAGGGSNFALENAGGTSLSGSSTTISGISGKDKVFIRLTGVSASSAYADITIQFNSDSGSNYRIDGYRNLVESTYTPGNLIAVSNATATSYQFCSLSSNAASRTSGTILLQGGNSAGVKIIQSVAGVTQQGGNDGQPIIAGGLYSGTSTISSVTVLTSAGTFDEGTIFVYTSA
jgi:hypothetical protein